jgi:hypothetical protein
MLGTLERKGAGAVPLGKIGTLLVRRVLAYGLIRVLRVLTPPIVLLLLRTDGDDVLKWTRVIIKVYIMIRVTPYSQEVANSRIWFNEGLSLTHPLLKRARATQDAQRHTRGF